jgi:hypothetical protein
MLVWHSRTPCVNGSTQATVPAHKGLLSLHPMAQITRSPEKNVCGGLVGFPRPPPAGQVIPPKLEQFAISD